MKVQVGTRIEQSTLKLLLEEAEEREQTQSRMIALALEERYGQRKKRKRNGKVNNRV